MHRVAVLVALLVALAAADVYMHNMRGSNNRLNEASNTRNNANRLFDSQNNNNGGYNVGDQGAAGSDQQGQLTFYEGSVLRLEWTNQHGCGANHNNLDCQLVLQYMCAPTGGDASGNADPAAPAGWKGNQASPMRDGSNTGTINENDPNNAGNGRQEPVGWYQECDTRERNRGLFIAEQNLNGDSATHTRQNPNGDRYGFECPEERDYYPYWHPSPWIDIAVLVGGSSGDFNRYCNYYQDNTLNKRSYNYCTNPVEANVEANCSAGNWRSYSHQDLSAGVRPAPTVDCVPAPWSRDNHLGDIGEGVNMYYDWTIPSIGAQSTCVLRLRYNITTGDYPGHPALDPDNFTDSRFNKEKSPIQDDPYVDFGIKRSLALAIDTAQLGRTFEDRSHIFKIAPRPNGVGSGANIWNLNVRGKRGNIVQVYPAVEYDFTPNELHIKTGDYVHIQWTGSNTNDNNNDGQGAAGTDKNNLVQIVDLNHNYPMPIGEVTMFDAATAVDFATVGLYSSGGTTMDSELNDRPATYDGGLQQFTKSGTFYYMCTRNNNFSNRSQKGSIIVD